MARVKQHRPQPELLKTVAFALHIWTVGQPQFQHGLVLIARYVLAQKAVHGQHLQQPITIMFLAQTM